MGIIYKLGSFLQKKSIRAETLPDFEKIDVLGVSNQVGVTSTGHKKSKDLSKYQLIEKGDLAYNPYRINVGSIGLVPNGIRGLVSPAYVVFSTNNKKLLPDLLFDFLKSKEGLFQIGKYARGTVRKALRFSDLCQIEMSIPSLKIQREITEKKIHIQPMVKKLENELTHQQILLKKLRQQILQEAIQGKLTADFRAQNPDIEPAGELLARIKAEKEQLIKEKKIKKQKPLPPISVKKKPFELPEGWVWCRLNELILENPRNGYSPKAVKFSTETKTLKLGATTSGKFIDTEIKYISEKIKKDSFLWLEDGHILVQRGNSLDFVGVSAIYKGGKHQFIYPDLMMKLKPAALVSGEFLHHVLMSPYCRKYFRDNASGAQKSMPKINQGVVSGALIPFCSIEEQKAIVTKVERLLALCDQLETQITTNQTHTEQLMQAVLKKAFSQSGKA